MPGLAVVGSALIMCLFSSTEFGSTEMMSEQLEPQAAILGYFEYKPDGYSFEFDRLASSISFPFDADREIDRPTQIRCHAQSWDYTLLVVPKSGSKPTLRIEKNSGTPGRAIFGRGVEFIIISGRWPVIETEHTSAGASGVVIVFYPFRDSVSGKEFDRYVLVQKLSADGALKARYKTITSPEQQLSLRGACVAISSDEVRNTHLQDDEAVEKLVAKIRGLGALTNTIPP